MATKTPMQLGMIGLGRMGSNLTRRLMRDGHHCVAYDVNADAVKALAARIIPELESDAEPELHHDSSTNALIRRYRAMR